MSIKNPKTFEEVRNYLSCIPAINQGGCGVAALAMYKWLRKQNEIEHRFKFVLCYGGYDEKTYLNNIGVLRNGKGTAIACEHIGIFYNGSYIDCDSDLPLYKYGTIQFIDYDEEWFMTNVLNNKGSWNYMFDRTNISKIEKDLKIDLKGIER